MELTPSATLYFPPGGGTCTTGLRVPVDGLVKGAVLNVTGLPLYTNHSWSANATEIWEGAAEKTNLTLSPEGIGLGGFGSWWEETAEEACIRGSIKNFILKDRRLELSDRNSSGVLLSPVLNISIYSKISVEGDFPNRTNYSVQILDPTMGNEILQEGLKNGDEINHLLWNERKVPYISIVMRLLVNSNDWNVTPKIIKWGVGTIWRNGIDEMSSSLEWDGNNCGLILKKNNCIGLEEFSISAATNNEGDPDITIDSNDTLLIVWTDHRSESTGADIYVKKFDKNWNQLGSEIVICSAVRTQYQPAIVVDLKNNFIVTWADDRENIDYDIYAKKFSTDGVQLGSEIVVCRASYIQDCPAIAADSKNNFIIVWSDFRNGKDYDIYCKRYDSTGKQLGNEIPVCTLSGGQTRPSIAVDSKDNFIITWADFRDGQYFDIYAKIFDKDGNQIGNEIAVCTAEYSQGAPSVDVDSNDNFIIAWEDDYKNRICARWFNTSGCPVSNEIVVTEGGAPMCPSVIVDSNDNFMITWQGLGSKGYDIYMKRFDRNGNPFGDKLTVCEAIDNQCFPSIAVDSAEEYIITWEDWRTLKNADVYARRFSLQHFKEGYFKSPDISPFGQTYGNIYINITVAKDTGYWVNILDGFNNILLSHLKNGDPILVDPKKYPKIRLNLTLWTEDTNNTPIVYEWGCGLHVGIKFNTISPSLNSLYDETGIELGRGECTGLPEIPVATTQGDESMPILAVDSKNNFIVTYTDFLLGDIYVKRFDINGKQLGDEIAVCRGPYYKGRSFVAINSKDEFIVAWEDYRNTFNYDIYAKRFTSDGKQLGSEIAVCTEGGHQRNPYVAIDGNDNIFIIWTDWRDGWENKNIYAKLYDPNGSQISDEIIICDAPGSQDSPSVTLDSNNNFFVAWEDYRNSFSDIYMKKFDWNGKRISPEFAVCTVQGHQTRPSIAIDSKNTIIVTWMDFRNWIDYNIYVKKFDTNGKQLGHEISICSAINDQQYPSVAVDSKDNFMVTWTDYRESANADIYAKLFDSSGKQLNNEISVCIAMNYQGRSFITVNSRQNFLIVWEDKRNGKDCDIYTRLFMLPYYTEGCFENIAHLSVICTAITPQFTAVTPPNTTINVKLRLSKDNVTWSNWSTVKPNETYYPLDFNSWGSYVQYNITLNTTDINITPIFKNFNINYFPYLVDGSIYSFFTTEGLTNINIKPSLDCAIPVNTSLHIEVSTDKGATWYEVNNNTGSNFTIAEPVLLWKIIWMGDGNNTPIVRKLNMEYSGASYPSNISIDVGLDEIIEWSYSEPLIQSYIIYNLTDVILNYVISHCSEAVDGFVIVPISITSATGGIITMSDAAVDFAPAPRILSHNPTGTNVSLNAPIEISFSEPMDGTSLNVTITPSVSLTASWSEDLRNVTLTHPDLKENTIYNVTVRAGALSLQGASMKEDYSWSFMTEKILIPIDSPKIIAWAPQGNRISINPTIMISFDREMVLSSVYSSFSIQPHIDVANFSHFNTTYYFRFASELKYETTYTVTISSVATSATGVPLALPFIWSFTTIALGERDSDLPTVLFTDPPDGAAGVDKNKIVSIVFSEAMDNLSTYDSFCITPPVDGTKSWLDNKGVVLQFRPLRVFQSGTYTITLLSSKARDESGNPLDGNGNGIADGAADDFAFSFSVWAPAPRLVSYSPTGTRVNLTEPIVLIFDRRMDLGSVRAAFSISPYTEGYWSIDDDGLVITFTPKTKYRPGTSYELVLKGTAADVDGIYLGNDVPWTFRTLPSAAVERAEFPWWIILLLVVCVVVGAAAAYYRLRSAPPPEAEGGEGRPGPEEATSGRAGIEAGGPGPSGAPPPETGVVVGGPGPAEAPPEALPVAAEVEAVAGPLPEARIIAVGRAPPGFAVEDIFLMYRDGRLIQHTTRRIKADMDVEVMTSMLKAVQDFVKDSLGMAEGAELGSMEYGENRIILEKGRYVILAAVITGEEPDGFRDEMKSAIRNIEGEFGAVLMTWDGTPAALAGARRYLTSLGSYTPAPAAAAGAEKDRVSLRSELEFYQGFVRMKVAVKNNMPTVIREVALKLVYNERALRLDRIEPEFHMEGREILLEDIEPGEKRTVAIYLDPQICTESHIEGVLTYKDAQGNLETAKLSRKLASVVCPIVYTDENINTAMLKRMAVEELDKKDTKVFSIPPGLTPQKAFELAKSAIQHHDVRLVREFTERSPYFVGEAWYYGKAKGREGKLVIRARVLGEKGVLEFFVASSSTLMLTGMLAELKSDLNKELEALKGRPVMRQVTRPEEVDAVAQIRTLLEKEAEAESAAGETEAGAVGKGR
ncbi:MAG: Ig-like domain-containing protein [Thermoplasmata archaeon]